MTQQPRSAEVVVIGGGVMGASAAYHLAAKGCRDVVLLEREPFFGQGATGRCAGGIRYQFSTEVNIRLSQLSLPMLARFEAEFGQPIDLRWCGYAFLLSDPADVERFQAAVALQNRLGVASEWLSGDEARRRLPQLAAGDILAATYHAGDGLCDPHGVVSGYIAAGWRLGVSALTDAPVSAIQTAAGRVVAVETPAGRIACGALVIAAGPWSAEVGRLAGLDVPVTPIRRQMLTTTPLAEIPADFPFVVDFGQSLYFHREGKGLLTGMSNPAQPAGFDQSVDEEWELTHTEAAIARLPLLARAGRRAAWAGLYEVTPDAHPLIGRAPELDNCYLLTGFSGHGFMHGPAAGLLAAEVALEGQASSLDIAALDPGRFGRGRPAREYNVI
ncbi:MAG: NAD(P)/FAD-dependent oxidoreductase [Candidatus Promineifilaceae bacterium]